MRRGKRMVHRHHAFFLFAVFEERKIDDPEKAQVVRLPHFELTSELQPQVAHQRPYLVAPARHHQERIARLEPRHFRGAPALLVAEMPRDRPLPTAISDLRPCKAEPLPGAHRLGYLVEFATR